MYKDSVGPINHSSNDSIIRSETPYSSAKIVAISNDKLRITEYSNIGTYGNYFWDGTDGILSTTGNVSLIVQNKNWLYDGDMVVKQYESLTVNAWHTITTEQPCRWLLIYVKWNLTLNGTISMHWRWPYTPNITSEVHSNGLRLSFITADWTDTFSSSDALNSLNWIGTSVESLLESKMPTFDNDITKGIVVTIPREGMGWWSNRTSDGPWNDWPDASAWSLKSGGGGWGGAHSTGTTWYGKAGTCFAGWSGGGPAGWGTNASNNAQSYGGKWWSPASLWNPSNLVGGQGNPEWDVSTPSSARHSDEGQGVGGLLIIIVWWDVIIGPSGKVDVSWVNGAWYSNSYSHAWWWASGAWVGFIAVDGSFTNNGTINKSWGTWTAGHPAYSNCRGWHWGDGDFQVYQLN